MRITLALDQRLLEAASSLTGVRGRSALIHRALQELILRESARRLAALGGAAAKLKSIPRRRAKRARAGWDKAFAEMAARGDDMLLDPEPRPDGPSQSGSGSSR